MMRGLVLLPQKSYALQGYVEAARANPAPEHIELLGG